MDLSELYRYSSGYHHSGADTMATLGILAFIAALVCTVLLMVLVTPEKRRDRLNTFFKALADLFNFKGLLLEYILKALYIFLTLCSIFTGFFSLFTEPLTGLLLMILGPIVLRVVFEFYMMLVILVKNVSQLNGKIPGKSADPFALPKPEKEDEEG